MSSKYKIYIHINNINKKVYIGQTCQKENRRWRNGNGYNHSPLFFNAIKKYGWNNFSHKILEENLSKSEANNREIYYINFYKSNNPEFGYNCSEGGNNVVISDKGKLRLKEKNTGSKNPNFGKPRTEETKKAISFAQLGKKNHMHEKYGSANPFYNKKHSKKTIEKMKNSAKNRGYNSHRAIRVICIETKEEFKSTSEAARRMNLNQMSVYRSAKSNGENSAGGFHFKRKEIK